MVPGFEREQLSRFTVIRLIKRGDLAAHIRGKARKVIPRSSGFDLP
jgi:hypothetical protein